MSRDTIAAVIDEYTTWMRSWGAAKRTVQARRTLATSRLRAWGLDGFTSDNVAGFLAGPQAPKKPWSKWTRATYHGHLTDFCSWLVAGGYLATNPMDDVRSPKRPKSKPRPLAEPEIEKVLSVVTGRTRDWILLALLAGLRASEIAAVRGEDVDEDGLYVLGKGDTRVTLPCHPELWEVAQKYPRSGYWFPGSDDGHIPGSQVSLTVGKLFDSLGIEGSIHRCRHSFGTRLLRSPTTNIRVVQKLMRHANYGGVCAFGSRRAG